MRGKSNMVETRLMKRIQAKGSYYFEVLVSSTRKPGFKLKTIVEFEKGVDQSQQIGLTAGALAEEMCERYGDGIDPSIAALEAIDTYEAVMSSAHFQLGDELPIGTGGTTR